MARSVVFSSDGLVYVPTEFEHGVPIYWPQEVIGVLCVDETGGLIVGPIPPEHWAWSNDDIPDTAKATATVGGS